MSKFVIVFFSFYIIIILSGCGSSDIINSRWTDEPIAMSATFDDWRGKTFYVQDKSLMVGVQNDGEYLYLTLMTGDRNNKMQILGRGLNIWFDREGGNDKYFGINYPTGVMGGGMMNMKRNDDNNNENGDDMMNQLFAKAQAQNDYNLLGPGENDKKSMSLNDTNGLMIQMDLINDVLIYKMKIALYNSPEEDISLGLNHATLNFGLGLEVPEFKFTRPKEDNNEQNNNGNMGEHKGHGNFGKGNRGSVPEQLKYWCNIKLAGRK